MHTTVLVLWLAAVALAAPAPQYRGNGGSDRTPGQAARYRNTPSEDAGRGNRQHSQGGTISGVVRQAPSPGTGSQQYRPRIQLAPLAPTSSQQRNGDAGDKRRPPVPIVRYQNSPTADGGNQHAYETGNGIEREEGVFIKELTVTGDDGKQRTVKIPVYRGSFKYQQPDGTFVEVQYEADETGFHAVGDSIPQALQ